jgi:hypothetical protein
MDEVRQGRLALAACRVISSTFSTTQSHNNMFVQHTSRNIVTTLVRSQKVYER